MLDDILLQQKPPKIQKMFQSVISFLTKTYGEQLDSSITVFRDQQSPQQQLYIILLTLHREKSLLEFFLKNESNSLKMKSFLPSLHSLSVDHLNFKLSPSEYVHQCKVEWIIA